MGLRRDALSNSSLVARLLAIDVIPRMYDSSNRHELPDLCFEVGKPPDRMAFRQIRRNYADGRGNRRSNAGLRLSATDMQLPELQPLDFSFSLEEGSFGSGAAAVVDKNKRRCKTTHSNWTSQTKIAGGSTPGKRGSVTPAVGAVDSEAHYVPVSARGPATPLRSRCSEVWVWRGLTPTVTPPAPPALVVGPWGEKGI